AFYANYPIALSAGLGLNAYFVIVCQTELKDVANPFTICLTAVFVEGLIFILLSFFKAREQIINVIPMNLKKKESCLVIYTPAIPADHQELKYFRENGFEIQKRAQVLGTLTKSHKEPLPLSFAMFPSNTSMTPFSSAIRGPSD
ncbi:MAG: hypothetical protein K6F53_00265, partial [Lachnospiraceae bacterium]|nr:hypothetical protein [Lachnospiraceae bacterium]